MDLLAEGGWKGPATLPDLRRLKRALDRCCCCWMLVDAGVGLLTRNGLSVPWLLLPGGAVGLDESLVI